MKHVFAALAVAALVAAPVSAQDLETYTEDQVAEAATAIEAAELSDEAYQNLWCGSAFLIINQMLEMRGMTDDAAQALGFADALFGNAATELIEQGVSADDFTALSQSFRVIAISQTGPDAEADYTQDECTAAAQIE